MDILMLLFLNIITVVFMQTCRELQVHEIAYANKFADIRPISCLRDLSFEQCAFECLLVTACMSINHMRSMCELLDDENGNLSLRNEKWSSYVSIRDWQQDVAGTCATRPCADNQRCIPTNPYMCMDIDCGIPPVLPVHHMDTNMNTSWINTIIGSTAQYMCRDRNKRLVSYEAEYRCELRKHRICNSDSSWTTQNIFCGS